MTISRLIIYFCLFIPIYTIAGKKYWINTGTVNIKYSDPNNWASSPGGLGGAGVPSTGDTAIFTSQAKGDCGIVSLASFHSLFIEQGYTGRITQGANSPITIAGNAILLDGRFTSGSSSSITIGSDLVIDNHVFSSTAGELLIGGNMTVKGSGGKFVHNNGTLRFNGGNHKLIVPGKAFDLYNLLLYAGSELNLYLEPGLTMTMFGDLTVDGPSKAQFKQTTCCSDIVLNLRGNLRYANQAQSAVHDQAISIKLNGGGAQSIFGGSISGRGLIPPIIIDKPGGTLTLDGVISLYKGITYLNGAVDPGTSLLSFYQITNGGYLDTEGMALNDVMILGSNVTMRSDLTINTLQLNSGSLVLNGHNLHIKKPASTALSFSTGKLKISDGPEEGKVFWDIGNNTGSYQYPFSNGSELISLSINVETSGAGRVSVSTYTTGQDNKPFPFNSDTVYHVNNNNNKDNSANVVDRFWMISKTGTGGQADIIFPYLESEVPQNGEDNLRAQRWNPANGNWDAPIAGQTADATNNYVSVTNITEFSTWALSRAASPLGGASAGKRYWVYNGITPGLFGNSLNWSFTSGGTPGAPVPGPGDVAVFDNGGTGDCKISGFQDVAGIRLESSYKGNIAPALTGVIPLNVGDSGVAIRGGSIDATIGDMNLICKGPFMVDGGTIGIKNTAFGGDIIYLSGSLSHPSGTAFFNGKNTAISGKVVEFHNVNIQDSVMVSTDVGLMINGDVYFGKYSGLDIKNNSLYVRGKWIEDTGFRFVPSGTVNFDGGAQQIISRSEFNMVTFANTGIKELVALDAALPIVVQGPLSIKGGAEVSLTGRLNFNGSNWNSGTGKLNAVKGLVCFCGSGTQTISADTVEFYNMMVNKPANDVLLKSHISVNGLFSMDKGHIKTNSYDLLFGDTLLIWIASDTSHVITGDAGRVRKRINSINQGDSIIFPVGDGSYMMPAIIIPKSGIPGVLSSIDVSLAAGKHPEILLTTNYLKDYWKIGTDNLTLTDYDIILGYNQNNVVGDESTFYPQRYDHASSKWEIDFPNSVVDKAKDFAYRRGLSDTGDFAVFQGVAAASRTISFDQTSLTVDEGVGSVNIPVVMNPKASGIVTVNFSTTGSATGGGVDYTHTGNTVVFAPGDTVVNIVVVINDDQKVEGDENIGFNLTTITGDANLGTLASFNLTIKDNDKATSQDSIGWLGPGGVGDSLTTAVWLAADMLSQKDGDPVSGWRDVSGNENDAFQVNAAKAPVFKKNVKKGKPGLKFDGIDDLILLPHADNIDLGTYEKKTIIIGFKTGDDVSSRQVLYKEGGDERGLNVYIEDNTLFFGGINRQDDDNGVTTPWNYKFVTSNVSPQTAYIAYCEFDFPANEMRLHLNGKFAAAANGIGKLFRHSGTFPSIGASDSSGYYHDGESLINEGYYFSGHIAEVIIYNEILNGAQQTIVHNYLSSKYGVGIPFLDDKYFNDLFYPNEVIGIGQKVQGEAHKKAQGRGMLRIEDPKDLNDDEYLMIGHNSARPDRWALLNVPPGAKRINRMWRVGELNDVGKVNYIVNIDSMPAISTGEIPVMMVDRDINFTDGNAVMIEMIPNQGSASEYIIPELDLDNGTYFSFGVVKPKVQFTSDAYDGFEHDTTGSFEVTLNYITLRKVSVNYKIGMHPALPNATPGAGGDYNGAASGTITILPGETKAELKFDILEDTQIEPDEIIFCYLTSPVSGAVIGEKDTTFFLLHDNDNPVKVGFKGGAGSGSEGIGSVDLIVRLTKTIKQEVTVNYAVGGSASKDDHKLRDGVISIPAGQAFTSLTFDIVDDKILEQSENIYIFLYNPVNANVTDSTQDYSQIYGYTIIDNDTSGIRAEAVLTNISCNGAGDGSIIIQASGGTAPYIYSVNGNPSTDSIFTDLGPGKYDITVYDVQGDSVVLTAILSEPALLVVDSLIAFDVDTCEGTVNMRAVVSGGNPPYAYNWSWLTVSEDTVFDLSDGNDISLTVTDSALCVVDTFFVVLIPDSGCLDDEIKVYSGITANNDGYNDEWIIEGLEISPENNVVIYDRWQHVVWTGENYDNENVVWKGDNRSGEALPEGTYFYIIKLTGKTLKGWVQLSR